MEDLKKKKKTLTLSSNVTKKIDLSSLSSDGKKTFSIEKKAPFRSTRDNKNNPGSSSFKKPTTIKKKCSKEVCWATSNKKLC